VSEDGELALVKATADGFTELARFKAIEGKRWRPSGCPPWVRARSSR
jgi:hypothetical protein